MPGLDLSTWPIWLIVGLQLIYLFKSQIGAFFPAAIREHFQSRAEQRRDSREHDQRIEEREQQRKSWREEQWVELILRKDAWLQEHLEKQLDSIESGNERIVAELAGLRGEITADQARQENTSERVINLLTQIHIALNRRYPR